MPVLKGLAHPQADRQQHALAFVGETPRDLHTLLGPVRPDSDERRIEEQRDQPDLVQITLPERVKRSLSSSQILEAVDLESFPSPACSHDDSTSRIDRP